MPQISARLPDKLVKSLDKTAARLNRTRADIIRQAVEYYLQDAEDLAYSIAVLQDPADPILDWESVKRDVLRKN